MNNELLLTGLEVEELSLHEAKNVEGESHGCF